MGIRFNFNLLPSFFPEEKIRFSKKRVWAFFVESLLTYRMNISWPPFVEAGLYVTDRRILLVISCFRVFIQESSQWFEGRGTAEDKEFIKEVCVGESRFWGPYLEVVSEGQESWYRGKKFRLRLYMRNPGPIRQIIVEEMTKDNL